MGTAYVAKAVEKTPYFRFFSNGVSVREKEAVLRGPTLRDYPAAACGVILLFCEQSKPKYR